MTKTEKGGEKRSKKWRKRGAGRAEDEGTGRLGEERGKESKRKGRTLRDGLMA